MQNTADDHERALVIATECGDSEACRELVERFLPAIDQLTRRYTHARGVEREDLLQEGVAALLFAARRFDPRLGTPFWPYAAFWVRKAMQELVADLARPVGLSDRAVRNLALIRSARREHGQAHRSEPTADELAHATGLGRAQVESLLVAERAPRGMEEPVSAEAGGVTVGETIADPRAEQAYARVLDRIEMTEVRGSVHRLDARERSVVLAHYGLGQPAETLDAIGRRLSVTAERARQIEAGALVKLRDSLVRPATLAAGCTH
jgi:RNA polymerase primary sigma factor